MLYQVEISSKGSGGVWDTYMVIADSAKEAIDKALEQAKVEYVKDPRVTKLEEIERTIVK